jgi:hypothetical protein
VGGSGWVVVAKWMGSGRWQWVAVSVHGSVWPCVAVCGSAWQCVCQRVYTVHSSVYQHAAVASNQPHAPPIPTATASTTATVRTTATATASGSGSGSGSWHAGG